MTCRLNAKCMKCGSKHHISICPRNEPGRQQEPSQEDRSSSSSLNPEAREFNSQSTATCLTENTALFVEGNETVLPQTAQAMVYIPTKAKCQTRARIVFDSGSQRSYVTDRIKNTLNLVSKGKRTMPILPLG